MIQEATLPTFDPQSWDEAHENGRWLSFLTTTLSNLLTAQQPLTPEQRDALGAMHEAASYFIDLPESSSNTARGLRSSRECWCQDISAAALAGPDSLAGDEFNQYVREGRPSLMTLEQVVHSLCSERNRNYMFSELTDEEAAVRLKALVSGYLTRLSNLRTAVKNVIFMLDPAQRHLVQDINTGAISELDLSSLYEEFLSHYAYETAFYVCLYQNVWEADTVPPLFQPHA